MAISEEARRNHNALCPDHHSTLKVTDPEFIAVFDNWAFGDVMTDGRRYSCRRDARRGILYQAVPYVGMAKVFDFLHTTNEVMKSRGIELPLQGESTTNPDTRREALVQFELGDIVKLIEEWEANGN
jgi:4-carboxymuconolactone decarboxylase